MYNQITLLSLLFNIKPPTFCLLSFSCLQHQCLQGALCPIAAALTAYCGTCDLNPSLTTCTWVMSPYTSNVSSATDSPSINTMREIVTTGLSTRTDRSVNVYKMAEDNSHTHTEGVETEGHLCLSHEEVVYSGDGNTHTFTGNL